MAQTNHITLLAKLVVCMIKKQVDKKNKNNKEVKPT